MIGCGAFQKRRDGGGPLWGEEGNLEKEMRSIEAFCHHGSITQIFYNLSSRFDLINEEQFVSQQTTVKCSVMYYKCVLIIAIMII